MNCPLPESYFRQFPAPGLNPPCQPAGYTLVSGSSSRRMDHLPGTKEGSQTADSKGNPS